MEWKSPITCNHSKRIDRERMVMSRFENQRCCCKIAGGFPKMQTHVGFPKIAKKKHGFPKQYVYLLHSTTIWSLHDFWCLTCRSITQSSGSILPTAGADHFDWKTYTSRFFRAGRPAKVVAMRSRKKYSLNKRSRRKGGFPAIPTVPVLHEKLLSDKWNSLAIIIYHYFHCLLCFLQHSKL